VRGRKEEHLKHPKGRGGDCMRDGSLQTQFGVNLQMKGVKNGVNEAKPMLP
jgi:hypothetical protein